MITSQDYLYEVLFRFGEDGVIAGAHRKDRTALHDSEGNIVSETISLAKPVSGADIESALGEIIVTQAATIDRLNQQIAALSAEPDTAGL